MFCPRCGHENADDSRFCVECGKQLREPPEAQEDAGRKSSRAPDDGGGLGVLARRVIGSTRRERLLTAGVAAALAIAVISLLALRSDEADEAESPADNRDPYLQQLDAVCLDAKEELQVAAAESAEVKAVGVNQIRAYTRRFPQITQRMRERISALEPPAQHSSMVAKLDAALARIAAAGRRAASYPSSQGERTLAEFGRIQRIGRRVESLIAKLGLTDCEAIQVVPAG